MIDEKSKQRLRRLTPTKQFMVLILSLLATWAAVIGMTAFLIISWRLTYTPAKAVADFLCPLGLEKNE